MQKINYAGHTLEVQILKDGQGEFYVQTKSTANTNLILDGIDLGTYPQNFAEEEATELITNLMADFKDLDTFNELSVRAVANRAIRKNVGLAIFEKVAN